MSASREHAGGGGGKRRGTGVVGRYLTDSRNPLNTVLLLLPIFLIYSAGLLMTGGVRNGVDLVSDLVRGWVFRGDDQSYLLFNLTGMVVVVLVAFVLREQGQFRPGIYLVVLAEGTLYGLLLGSLVPRVLGLLPVAPPRMALAAGASGPVGLFDGVILSLGAGLWEELVFRWLLLGGMVRLLTRALKRPAVTAWVVGVLVSSVLFSALHYVGSLGDSFTLYSFLFRFLSGGIFSLIFGLRGLAVVVYTHAVYDIMVVVLRI